MIGLVVTSTAPRRSAQSSSCGESLPHGFARFPAAVIRASRARLLASIEAASERTASLRSERPCGSRTRHRRSDAAAAASPIPSSGCRAQSSHAERRSMASAAIPASTPSCVAAADRASVRSASAAWASTAVARRSGSAASSSARIRWRSTEPETARTIWLNTTTPIWVCGRSISCRWLAFGAFLERRWRARQGRSLRDKWRLRRGAA